MYPSETIIRMQTLPTSRFKRIVVRSLLDLVGKLWFDIETIKFRKKKWKEAIKIKFEY